MVAGLFDLPLFRGMRSPRWPQLQILGTSTCCLATWQRHTGGFVMRYMDGDKAAVVK
jgi:hypothetical protein